ncbi:hypothetical protein TYRP_008736 [Tyrophagus putrescentiae]|nr:hypothetical protein TYRP_008736 [Tyrophagus putrescentiae]
MYGLMINKQFLFFLLLFIAAVFITFDPWIFEVAAAAAAVEVEVASAGAAGTLVGVFDGDVAAAAAELETGELEKRRLRGLGFFTFGPLLLAAAAFDIAKVAGGGQRHSDQRQEEEKGGQKGHDDDHCLKEDMFKAGVEIAEIVGMQLQLLKERPQHQPF